MPQTPEFQSHSVGRAPPPRRSEGATSGDNAQPASPNLVGLRRAVRLIRLQGYVIARETRSSSPRPLARCHTLRSIDGEDETIDQLDDRQLRRRPGQRATMVRTGLTACSLGFTRRWNGCWGRSCSTRPSSRCWNARVPRPRSARPAVGGCSPCRGQRHPGWPSGQSLSRMGFELSVEGQVV